MKTAAHIAHVINNLAKGHSIIVTLDVLLSFTWGTLLTRHAPHS